MKSWAHSRRRGGCLSFLAKGALLDVLLLFVLACVPAVAQPEARHSIRVVTDNNYPPFSFRDEDGELRGILVDEWRLWEAQTAIKVELQALEWDNALQRMKAGEFDVIDTIFTTREWAGYWDFSQPYARISVPVFFRKDISGITDLKSLKGFPVAAKAGDVIVDLLKQNGIATVLLFTNYQAIVQAAKEHKVNVFVADQPSAVYLLQRQGLQDEFKQSAPVMIGELHRAVQKGNSGLLKTIDSGFAAIRPEKLRQIEEKWYGQALGGSAALRYVGYGAVAGLVGLLGLMIWNLALNRLVNRRTADLRRINRTLHMISVCNEVLVRATDETELLQAVCRLAVETGGYRMAWVGFALQDESKSVRPVAQAGFEAGYLEAAGITWGDNERGRGPTGTCIRTGEAVVARNFLTDATFSPWRQAALDRGYAASASLPLQSEGHVLGALMVYAEEPGTFDAGEVKLLSQLASDLAYGITALRTRGQQRRTEQELHRLSARLLQVQDQERRRVARELHDTAAQHLAVLSLNLAQLRRALPPGSATAQTQCGECLELANRAAGEIRTHSYLLHPPLLEAMGLAGAVEDYIQGFSARSGIKLELESSPDFGRLSEDMELALFRVIQESLANVLKHSGSECAKIRLTRQPSLVILEVQDMGHGIPAEKLARLKALSGGSGVGLGGMHERLSLLGGRLDLESGPTGTTVRASVPLAPSAPNPVPAA